MREGKRKATEIVKEEAEDDRQEREDLETWDGMYHLSVFAGPPEAGDTVDKTANRLFGTHRRFKFYRVALLAALEEAGFELRASLPDPYHYDAVLGTNLTDPVVEKFDNCFEEARRNPQWRHR